ncbi:SET domain protein [Aspergillus undulatus]|uniref:SET domain protein n=1 Tax=Aspergillus undulatus TaxID=1810928 RepID=UPI003CCE3260
MAEAASALYSKIPHQNSLEVYSALLEWMKSHGGSLHENVSICYDNTRGTHIRVKGGGVPSNTHIIKTPVATTMSYFNAIDHRVGETRFPARGLNFPPEFVKSVGPEEVTIFFLIGQYLRGSESFWYPYLQTLPQPGSLTTLPYYEEEEDLEWLEGTSLVQARLQKIALLREKYESSYEELRKSELDDAARYSWDLYLWASTIFVSRAFSAKVLSGVLPDLGVPEENISVLLPFIDILNHRPLAKVEWRAGIENVDFVTLEYVGAEQEIANNYGPRNNEQLMMNYGFCLPNNPCDYRTVALRAPPGSPLQFAREQQKQLFPDSHSHAQSNTKTEEQDPFYVFNIFYPLLAPDIPMEHSIFSPALFNAVSILAANERELGGLEISDHAIQIANNYGNSRAALAALSQIVIELITHIVRLRSTAPEQSASPRNLKQIHAKIYRESQIQLSESALVIATWSLSRACTHGLKGSNSWDETKQLLAGHMAAIPPNKFPPEIHSRMQVRILERPSILLHTGELFTFSELIDLLPSSENQHPASSTFKTILTTASRRIRALRGLGLDTSPFRFVLFACYVVAVHTSTQQSQRQSASGISLPPRLSRWVSFLLDNYLPPPDDVAWTLEDEDDEALVNEFDEVVESLRRNNAGIFEALEDGTGGDGGNESELWWLSPNWVRWAWMMTEQEVVQVPVDALGILRVCETEGEEGGDIMLETETLLYIPQE